MDGGAEYGRGLNLEATELRLGLPGRDVLDNSTAKSNKRAFSDAVSGVTIESVGDASESDGHETSPATKAQVVGWPPVRSYRKNNIHISSGTPKEKKAAETAGIYVKVSMDGAPYLRKIDLKPYNDYQDLLKALEKMFSCFIAAGEFANRDGSDYVPTYEDKDGDWMLVGDVPWKMFISSCKRLRIMKGSDAKGLGSGSSNI